MERGRSVRSHRAVRATGGLAVGLRLLWIRCISLLLPVFVVRCILLVLGILVVLRLLVQLVQLIQCCIPVLECLVLEVARDGGDIRQRREAQLAPHLVTDCKSTRTNATSGGDKRRHEVSILF